jgi:hypothetical protein
MLLRRETLRVLAYGTWAIVRMLTKLLTNSGRRAPTTSN